VIVPLTSEEEEEGEDDAMETLVSPRGLCVVQALKTTGFMNMLYEAYLSKDPLSTMREKLELFPSIKVNWARIQDLLALVRWNVTETQDDSHPMAFVVQDIKKLRAKPRDKTKEEDQELIVWTFCFYATSIPQVWCTQIIENPHGDNGLRVARLNPDMKPCAYRMPNEPVPWVWFNANGHASIVMVAHNMGVYKKRVLRVALYRKFKVGMVNTIKPEFTFDKHTDAQPYNMSLLHLIVDTTPYDDGVGGISIRILKPVKGWTFMIFLSEGARYTFVSATLNESTKETERLLKYPVVLHELHRGPDKEAN